jgi:hypothetical protein
LTVPTIPKPAIPTKQKPADLPVLYLDASPGEETLWQNLKSELKDVAIVLPLHLIQSNGDQDPLGRAQQLQRRQEYANSRGLVFLHSGDDSWLEYAVRASYNDRYRFRQQQRDLPWAILDYVGERPQVADLYDVPCVPTASNSWQQDLLTVLGLSSSSLGAML